MPTSLDDALGAYTDGLERAIACLRQVEALAAEQRAAWSRNDLLPLGALATRRAALMHDLAAIEAQVAPLRDRLLVEPIRARQRPGFAAVEARHAEARTLIERLMAADRELVADLEGSVRTRRREAQDLDTGGATLAAYKRVVFPTVHSAGLIDSRG
jgi:hypothetical protein